MYIYIQKRHGRGAFTRNLWILPSWVPLHAQQKGWLPLDNWGSFNTGCGSGFHWRVFQVPKKRLKRISYLSSFNDMLFFLMGGFNPLKTMTIISANHLKYGPFLNKETINQFSSIRLFRDHQPAIHGCQRAQTKAQHPFPSASNSATSPGEPCPKILQSPMQKMLLVMLWVKTLAP